LKYLIHRTDTNRYLMAQASNWVTRKDAYAWTTQEAAERRKIQLLKEPYYSCVEVIPEDIVPCATKILSDEEAAAAYKALRPVAEHLKTLDDLIGYYNEKIKEYDDATLDMLHRIELGNIGGIVGFRLLKQLKELRIKRRECKDNFKYCTILRIYTTPKELTEAVDKYEAKLKTRVYTPRVLKDLFDKKGD